MGALLVIIDIVTLDFESLKKDIAGIWNNIKDGFSQIWEGIKQVFIGAGEAIKGYLTFLWESLKNGILTTWTTVTNFLSTTWENIKAGAIEGWNSFKEGVANVITGAVEWIKETWNNTVEWFSTLPSRLYEKGVEMFNSLKDGIAEMKDTVVSKVKEVGTGIIEKAKELPGEMLQIGKDIMSGLADGIKSMITAPVRAIKGAAEKIADGIRNKLKIKSPSRVMIEYGEFTTEGLAKGIEDRIPKLEAVVGTTYEVITKEEAKENKITRTPILQQAYEKIKSFRPFYPVFEPDDPEGGNKPIPRVALAGAGGGTTYNIYIDDIDVNVSGTGDGSNEDIYEIVEQAQEEFGRKLLEALKDKK